MLTMSSGLSMERMMVCRLRGTPLSWARWYTSSHCCHLLFSLWNITCKKCKPLIINNILCSHVISLQHLQLVISLSLGVLHLLGVGLHPWAQSNHNISGKAAQEHGSRRGNKDIMMEHFSMMDIGLAEYRKICKPYHCDSSLSKEASNYWFCSKFAVKHFSNFWNLNGIFWVSPSLQ